MDSFLILSVLIGLFLLAVCFAYIAAEGLINSPTDFILSLFSSSTRDDYLKNFFADTCPTAKLIKFVGVAGLCMVFLPLFYWFIPDMIEEIKNPKPTFEDQIQEAIEKAKAEPQR